MAVVKGTVETANEKNHQCRTSSLFLCWDFHMFTVYYKSSSPFHAVLLN